MLLQRQSALRVLSPLTSVMPALLPSDASAQLPWPASPLPWPDRPHASSSPCVLLACRVGDVQSWDPLLRSNAAACMPCCSSGAPAAGLLAAAPPGTHAASCRACSSFASLMASSSCSCFRPITCQAGQAKEGGAMAAGQGRLARLLLCCAKEGARLHPAVAAPCHARQPHPAASASTPPRQPAQLPPRLLPAPGGHPPAAA